MSGTRLPNYNHLLTELLDKMDNRFLLPQSGVQQNRNNYIRLPFCRITPQSTSLLEMRDILVSMRHMSVILELYQQAPSSPAWKQQAIAFLQQRAAQVLNGPLCYTLNQVSPINDLCIKLAKLCDKEHTNSLLMPAARKEDIYGNDFDELHIGQFILTDDKLSFISLSDIVDTVFNRSVEAEANPYLTTTAEGQTRNLSATEIARLGTVYHRLEDIRHKITDRGFLASLVQRNAHRLHNELICLRRGLRDGDARHNGQEMNAGASANEAIVRFRQYYESLSANKRLQIRAIGNPQENLGILFDIMCRDPNLSRNDDGSRVIYCMGLVGGRLETIINNNREALLGINDSLQECLDRMKNQLLTDIRERNGIKFGVETQASQENQLASLMNELNAILTAQTKNPEHTALLVSMVTFIFTECRRNLLAAGYGAKLDCYANLLLAIGMEAVNFDKHPSADNELVLQEIFKRITLLSSCTTAMLSFRKVSSKINWQQWILTSPVLQSYPFIIQGKSEFTYLKQYTQTYSPGGNLCQISTPELTELRRIESEQRDNELRLAAEQRALEARRLAFIPRFFAPVKVENASSSPTSFLSSPVVRIAAATVGVGIGVAAMVYAMSR